MSSYEKATMLKFCGEGLGKSIMHPPVSRHNSQQNSFALCATICVNLWGLYSITKTYCITRYQCLSHTHLKGHNNQFSVHYTRNVFTTCTPPFPRCMYKLQQLESCAACMCLNYIHFTIGQIINRFEEHHTWSKGRIILCQLWLYKITADPPFLYRDKGPDNSHMLELEACTVQPSRKLIC